MDDFTAAYLRCDATLALVPGVLLSNGAETSVAYPAVEVAAAIARLKNVRGASRRPPAGAGDWSERRWRWREGERKIAIDFSVRAGAAAQTASAIWAASPLVCDCLYEDVAQLAQALARRLPALRLRLDDVDDGRLCEPADFIGEVALARLAPALASDDPAIRAQAEAARERYAALLAETPRCIPLTEALAAAPYATLYEDVALLAVYKPAGVVTHPTYKHPAGTLTDAVFADAAARGLPRPWLLHRLDKETSGVTLFARTEAARRSLASQFAQRLAHKRYLALACWPPTLRADLADAAPGAAFESDAPLARDPLDRRRVVAAPDGQPARTRFRLLAVAQGAALLLAEPVTGRTHQIRAHLAAFGAPLLGDATYLATLPADDARAGQAPPNLSRAMLHAWRLDLRYPSADNADTSWSVSAPPPDDFVAAAEALGLGAGLRAALASASHSALADEET